MHPAPHSFMHLHLAHFKLHPALRNTLNVIRTDIAQNWKIGKHGILEVLIPNPDLDFWNSDPKIQFWANFGRKSQSCSFCLKIGTHSISRMLILITTFSEFPIQNPFLGKFGPKKSKLSVLPENWHTWYLEDADFSSDFRFLNFKT